VLIRSKNFTTSSKRIKKANTSSSLVQNVRLIVSQMISEIWELLLMHFMVINLRISV
jgi:hypothetical protein